MSWFEAAYAMLVRFHPFIMGATCALNLTATVFFLRFYRRTADRLFLFFSVAFLLMGLNRIGFQVSSGGDEANSVLYLVRLAAFCLILFAIVDKNRPGRGMKKVARGE